MKFIEEKGKLSDGTKITKDMLRSDSSDWGNYNNKSFNITRGQYTTSPNTIDSWKTVTSTYTRPNGTSVLLTTGATNRNSTLNIYDLAGNVWELTLEKSNENPHYSCVARGGFIDESDVVAKAYRHQGINPNIGIYSGVGFRSALY